MAEGNIGSVGVEVVPDARTFWERFQQQTRTGATEAGRRARADFDRGFNAGPDPVIRVRTDTRGARSDIQAVRRDLSNASASNDGLLKSLLPLAPALVPLAGAASLGAAALVEMGATGTLAVKGIQAQMKASTARS